ncbi:hypothetical protein C8Q77DRAFT_620869 [Trametes polyzona]|nr:hypothetical protein C8Q77DRAFT_620869 [Trametes polyzona]
MFSAMSATNVTAYLDASQLHYLSTHRPYYYTPRSAIVDRLPDHYLALAVPVVAYWALGLVFHLLDISGWKWLDRYRIHDSAEVMTPLASRSFRSCSDSSVVVVVA